LSNPVHVRCGKGSRGSDPRLLRPNNGLATRPHIGERPRASRIVRALGLDQPSINTIAQQDRQLKPRDPYGLGASTCTAFRAAGTLALRVARSLYCESAYELTPNRLPTVTLVGRPINSSTQCVAVRGPGSDSDADRASDPTPNNSSGNQRLRARWLISLLAVVC
jgi:hypothetical protein